MKYDQLADKVCGHWGEKFRASVQRQVCETCRKSLSRERNLWIRVWRADDVS
jgi:hypothetical protein